MKDFRDNIKNYKASPNDQVWERMLIKKEKKGIKKMKLFLYLLLAINAAALIFWSIQNWNSPTIDTNSSGHASSKNDIILENTEDSKKIIQLTELSNLNQEKISSLSAENSNLKSQLLQLKESLEINKLRFSKLANQNNPSGIPVRKTTPVLFNALEIALQPKETEKIELTDNSVITFLPAINKNYLQDYLIDLASKKKHSILYFQNETIINEKAQNWYLSVGTNYEYLVAEKQRSIVLGLYRSLGKRFDAGITFEFSNQRERSRYKFDSKVVDQKTVAHGLFIIRYKAFRINKFMIHADAGVGYRILRFTNRESSMIRGELQYINDLRRGHGLDLQLGIGTTYQISPQLNLGTRIFLDANLLHTNLNLNYRF